MNRRTFLASSAAVPAAGLFAAGRPQQKARVGLIGCGWYGKLDVRRLLQVASAEVVSLCDVDRKMLAEAVDLIAERQGGKKPRTFTNYQDMLKEKDLDIVEVATPDH